MNNNEYTTIGLYDHNADSYRKVKAAFDSGEKVVGIVHATGTGKSFNALQLAYDNKDKKIMYVVPSNGIIEHIKEIIESSPNLDLKRDFPNLEFITYQKLSSMKDDEIFIKECDLMILDEFHHIGAPIWGKKINHMVETHPNMKIFGMTAYTVRDRGTAYERDMANPDTEELFSNKIVSRYDLCDAFLDGVLPKPNYVTCYTHLLETEEALEEMLEKQPKNSKDYIECSKLLSNLKKQIHEAKGIEDVMKANIKPGGKYVYFCPPGAENGVNDIETIKKEALEWFKQVAPEEDIVFYTTTSDMGVEGKKNMGAFYDDKTLDGENCDNMLRVMFAINQYNEGIHAPNLDGVIMGRGTSSDILFYEQLGRGLSVRGDTKDKFDEYMTMPYEELLALCKEKDLPIEEGYEKEDLVERLVAPIIIDLTNNIGFIEELEDNLKDRIKLYQQRGLENHRDIKLRKASFFISTANKNLFDILKYVEVRLTMTWEKKYELAKAYYDKHGDLEIPEKFKTVNGYEYDENGIELGSWIFKMRSAKKGKSTSKITSDQIELLNKIGMRWENIDPMVEWMRKYNLAKAYYDKHRDLEIPGKFKTVNGYEYDEDGEKLGQWISYMRSAKKGKSTSKITSDQIELLNKIGMRWENINPMVEWMKKYNLAKAYYDKHHDLEIPAKFKTINGHEYDEEGEKLGRWISDMRKAKKGKSTSKITPYQIKLLNKIGMRWENIDPMVEWMRKYNLAKAYYDHNNKSLKVPKYFKTINGYEYDKDGFNLYQWLIDYRLAYYGKGTYKISRDQAELLEKIGIVWFSDKNDDKLQEEMITEDNLERKQFEIQNRTHTLLNKFDDDSLPSKEELNEEFLGQLNHKK